PTMNVIVHKAMPSGPVEVVVCFCAIICAHQPSLRSTALPTLLRTFCTMPGEKSIKLDPKTEAVFKKKGYNIEKMLNEGAFGQVYKGSNTRSGELVAIKVMDLDAVGEKFKQKFLPRELAAL